MPKKAAPDPNVRAPLPYALPPDTTTLAAMLDRLFLFRCGCTYNDRPCGRSIEGGTHRCAPCVRGVHVHYGREPVQYTTDTATLVRARVQAVLRRYATTESISPGARRALEAALEVDHA